MGAATAAGVPTRRTGATVIGGVVVGSTVGIARVTCGVTAIRGSGAGKTGSFGVSTDGSARVFGPVAVSGRLVAFVSGSIGAPRPRRRDCPSVSRAGSGWGAGEATLGGVGWTGPAGEPGNGAVWKAGVSAALIGARWTPADEREAPTQPTGSAGRDGCWAALTNAGRGSTAWVRDAGVIDLGETSEAEGVGLVAGS